jgi:hypothetical protein
MHKNAKQFKEFKHTFFESMVLLRQIAAENDEKKNEEVKKIFNETKDKLAKLIDEK